MENQSLTLLQPTELSLELAKAASELSEKDVAKLVAQLPERRYLPEEKVESLQAFCELSPAALGQLSMWHEYQIRKLPTKVAAAAIGHYLDKCSRGYGLREKPDEEVVEECIRLIGRKFSFLAPHEILEAYRAWGSEETQTKAGEMYGGRMNARQVGAIISEYCKLRKFTMAKYLNAEHEAKREHRKINHNQKWEDAFEDLFFGDLDDAVENLRGWQGVREFWYQALRDRGLLKFTKDQAIQIFEEAKPHAIFEHSNLQKEGSIFEPSPARIGKAQSLKDALDGNTFKDKKLEGLQKIIARKMTIWKFYIMPRRVTSLLEHAVDVGLCGLPNN